MTIPARLDAIADELTEHPERWCQFNWHIHCEYGEGAPFASCTLGHCDRNGIPYSFLRNAIPVRLNEDIGRWNDAPERTVQDVIAAFRKAAELAREGA